MSIIKKLFTSELSIAEREELRHLRIKCEYQERWIHGKQSKTSGHVKFNEVANQMASYQRKVDRLFHEQPEIWKNYFSSESTKKRLTGQRQPTK